MTTTTGRRCGNCRRVFVNLPGWRERVIEQGSCECVAWSMERRPLGVAPRKGVTMTLRRVCAGCLDAAVARVRHGARATGARILANARRGIEMVHANVYVWRLARQARRRKRRAAARRRG